MSATALDPNDDLQFQALLERYLDGDLSSTEAVAFEQRVHGSPELERRLAGERALREKIVQALARPVAPEERNKALMRFRGAVVETHLEAVRAESRRPSFWVRIGRSHFAAKTALAGMAAGILVALVWSSGYFRSHPSGRGGSEVASGHSHSRIIADVWSATAPYYGDVGVSEARPVVDRSRLESWAKKQPCGKAFPSDCSALCAKRLGECMKAMAEYLPAEYRSLRFQGVELAAARLVDLKVGDRTLRVPHFILAAEKGEASAYFFKSADAALVFESLVASKNPSETSIQLHECPDCAIVARKIGEHVALFLSCMSHHDLRLLAVKL